MATWPQYYAVNTAPYNVGGPIDNAVLQKSIEATYWPTSLIWFPTKDAAESWAKNKGGGNSAGVPGTGVINNAVNSATNAASGVAVFYQAIEKFLGALSNTNTWIRVAEVVIGVALIIGGLDKALAGTPAGGAAHAVAKGVMLA